MIITLTEEQHRAIINSIAFDLEDEDQLLDGGHDLSDDDHDKQIARLERLVSALQALGGAECEIYLAERLMLRWREVAEDSAEVANV